jgi:hypothetical protein
MDARLVETLNGGDLEFFNRDIATLFGFGNMPYLAMFGGNPSASTPTVRLESEQAFDWWGNTALMPNQPLIQFNSETERRLHLVSLNSQGRLLIDESIKKDLQFMQPFAKITVEVTIVGVDRVRFYIAIQEPGNVERKEFIYIWDGTRLDFENGAAAVVPSSASPNLLNYALTETSDSSATNTLTFEDPYTSTNYAPLVFDYGGGGLGRPTLYSNRMEVTAGIPYASFAWLSALIYPAHGIRSGLTTVSFGTQPINFATLGDLGYTVIATDYDQVGMQFNTTNASMGFASFNVVAPIGGGRVAWVVIKDGYFSNMRTGRNINHPGGSLFIPFDSTFGTDDYTPFIMDMNNVGPGNIISILRSATGLTIECGSATRLNYLCILN